MIEALIFDAEGVIVDSESVWDHGQEEFLRRRGRIYDRERTKPLLTGRSMIDGVRVMQRQYDFGGDAEELARERLEIVRDLFAHEVTFIPGFLEFYERVRQSYATCVATAMDRGLLELIDRRLHLSDLFDDHVYSLADVGFKSKPAPDLFLHAAAQLGVEPTRCAVIEDAPHGVEAAHRAGMLSIGLATTYEPDLLRDADLVVETFDQIDLDQLTQVAALRG